MVKIEEAADFDQCPSGNIFPPIFLVTILMSYIYNMMAMLQKGRFDQSKDFAFLDWIICLRVELASTYV